MPFTFSHPLAVIPLRRLCPRWLNFSALVTGSIAPDLGYFAGHFSLAGAAHHFWGSLSISLPLGFLALICFYLVRKQLCFLLPEPHRSALSPLAANNPRITLRELLVAVISLLIGIWTHCFWDSFTHSTGWMVKEISFLQAPILTFGQTIFHASYLLQQFSTFAAGMSLAVLYFLWLRRQGKPLFDSTAMTRDGWRYGTIILLIIVSLMVACPKAYLMATHYEGFLAFRVFTFRTGVYSIAAFFPLFLIASFFFHAHAINKKQERLSP